MLKIVPATFDDTNSMKNLDPNKIKKTHAKIFLLTTLAKRQQIV